MNRVANALEQFKPEGVELVTSEAAADLLVLHVIGLEAIEYRTHQRCAVIQYCVNSATREGSAPWHPLWSRANLVWSYYDLAGFMPAGANFYRAPMGLDPVFRRPFSNGHRDVGVMTSGYVNGHGQEAIEEPIVAAHQRGLTQLHLGPIPEGLTPGVKLNYAYDIGDTELVSLYQRTKWVAAMRFVEGFEMPAIEGLACGARPIVFDRPDMHHWYDGHAIFVPECSGQALIDALTPIVGSDPNPVTSEERAAVLAKFNWRTIVGGFWSAVKESV